MVASYLFLVLLLSLCCSITRSWQQSSRSAFTAARVSMAAVTYTPVVLQTPKQKKATILVKSGEKAVMEEVTSWQGKESIDEERLETFTQQGLAFWLTPQGTRAIHTSELEGSGNSKQGGGGSENRGVFGRSEKPETMRYLADFYIKAESASKGEIYIKSSKAVMASQLASGSLSTDLLIKRGEAFVDVGNIFAEEKVISRANSIATKVSSDYPITSTQWKLWTNKTTSYNATSLTQVMAAYYQSHSIGDIGGPNADYVEKKGFPGTLAPGEKFQDNAPAEGLPRKVLHPWPAMQQIQFHVRWPPNHPMLPPPLLWFGLNDMYTEKFTEDQLNTTLTPCEEIIGGTQMDPKHAIRIARFGILGSAYKQSEQLNHGGMIFPGGYNIPHYNPDHGPTYDNAEPPIPNSLLPITERWLSPYYGLEIPVPKTSYELEEFDVALEEEEVRRLAAERLMRLQPKTVQQFEEEKEVQTAAEELTRLMLLREAQALENARQQLADSKSSADKTEEGDDADASVSLDLPEEMDEEVQKAHAIIKEQQVAVARSLSEAINGKARSPKALIRYTIETIRDMVSDVQRTEKDQATRRKGGGRRRQKGSRRAEASEV